jgi:hypothetical protein
MSPYDQLDLIPPPSLPWASQQRRRSRPARPRPENRGRHENSLAARQMIESELTGRCRDIIDWLRAHGPATDRAIRDGVCGPAADMNCVRPRISDMISGDILKEIETVPDFDTGRPVRVVWFK